MGKKKKKQRPTITIGTDPEFALVDKVNFEVKRANAYRFFNSSRSTAKIGCDGAGTPVELRPSPTKLNELKYLIRELNDNFLRIGKFCQKEVLTIVGGAMGGNEHQSIPIGCHIHFGSREFLFKKERRIPRDHGLEYVPSSLRNSPSPTKSSELDTKINIDKLVHSLDTYLIPIANFFVDNKELYKRRETGYGRLSEHRKQRWGIEYRTPYCFLLSPLLTTGLYALASLIAYNYKKIAPDKNLYKEALYYYENLENEERCRKIQKNIYKKTKPRILSLLSHNSPNPEYNSYIISMFNLIKHGKTCKNKDVLDNYRIYNVEYPPFTVHYSSSDNIRHIREYLEPQIKNNSKGEIYLYELPYDFVGERNRKIIRLRTGMPKIAHEEIRTIYKEDDYMGFKYHIGISGSIVRDYARNMASIDFLIKYINNLRLKNNV